MIGVGQQVMEVDRRGLTPNARYRMPMFTPNGIITLTTDFGLGDAYVAIMKGVILLIAPEARLIDYTHGIMPGNIVEAAYLLRSGYSYYPRGTIHVVVVDPGVGSARRAILVQTPDAVFIGPDNGVFTLVAEDARQTWGDSVQTIELTERRFWLPQVSATFHGRDIFAPTAAWLLRGTPLHELGHPISDPTSAEVVQPQPIGPRLLGGQIIHIDRFGNCITNITAAHLERHGLGRQIVVQIIDQQLPGLFRTYVDGPHATPMCLIGSSEHLEIAVFNGNAAQYLGVAIGDKLHVRST